ncbi:hypothetical protein V0288_09375 [Pannus brasiliensis CCIBt3594]|uniref:DUF2188 domain-containing protein n=1 Tax=Pannus brasiliensis CCIBt3594 TaxID=1427578 RepID=A0AAW9QUQ5_9CHRO
MSLSLTYWKSKRGGNPDTVVISRLNGKSKTPEAREKAIEIANALLEEGYEEGRAIAIATAQAEKWAENRDKPIKNA